MSIERKKYETNSEFIDGESGLGYVNLSVTDLVFSSSKIHPYPVMPALNLAFKVDTVTDLNFFVQVEITQLERNNIIRY